MMIVTIVFVSGYLLAGRFNALVQEGRKGCRRDEPHEEES